MFTISWHFKPHKVTLWHWCMASAAQSFEKAHATLSFRCAPAYTISTGKNNANKTDASPGVETKYEFTPWPVFSPVPRLHCVQCAVSNKGCIWDNEGCAVQGRCQICSTWGAWGCVGCSCPGALGALGRAAPAGLEAMEFLFPECSHMAFRSTWMGQVSSFTFLS